VLSFGFKDLRLKWATDELETSFEGFRFYGIPVCILMTLFGTIRPNESTETLSIKVILTGIFSVISFVCLVGVLFSDMCTSSYHRVLFEEKVNTSHKIVERNFGCGATDSSPAPVSVFELWEVTPLFIWVEKVDTSQMDLNEWNRIEEE
jgi:hypothetical protein